VIRPDGTLLRTIGEPRVRSEELSMVQDVAVDPSGNVSILDSTAEPSVRVYSPLGERIAAFGEHSDKPEGLHFPVGISADSEGRLWIADCFAHEVKAFTTRGEVLATIGGMGTADGALYFPSDVACGAGGSLYVAERGGDRVQAFHIEAEGTTGPGGTP